MSPIVTRDEAVAYTDDDITSVEPITVVLSSKGWIRAAKGHDIDPLSLSYKSGDSYKLSARGKSNQAVIILDSSGEATPYPLEASPLQEVRVSL